MAFYQLAAGWTAISSKESAQSIKTTCRLSQFERFKLRHGMDGRSESTSRAFLFAKVIPISRESNGVSQSIAGLTRTSSSTRSGPFELTARYLHN